MYNTDMKFGYMVKDRGNNYYVFSTREKALQKLCDIAIYLYKIINEPLTEEALQTIKQQEYFFFCDSKVELMECLIGD